MLYWLYIILLQFTHFVAKCVCRNLRTFVWRKNYSKFSRWKKMTNMRSEYVEFALAVTLEFWNVGSIQMYPSEVVKSL